MFLRAFFVVTLLSPSSVLAYTIDQEPRNQNSPLIATPEAVRLQPYTGGASFTYGLDLPQGTGGLTPELALTYSSLTKNTEYGWGWTLNIPKIERCTRFGPPTYDDANRKDKFELDGELLIPDPVDVNRFHKSAHDYSLILFDDNPADSSWEIVRTDGTRFRFGSRATTSNSRLTRDPGGTGPAFRWSLDEVVDSRGNSYQIDYDADSQVLGAASYYVNIRPKSIRYSFHTSGGDHATRLVEFRWEDRGDDPSNFDLPTNYRAGIKIQVVKRLKEIAIGYDTGNGIIEPGQDEQIRRYEFAYAPKTSASAPLESPFSKLVSIQRYGSDDTAFPDPSGPRATTFQYWEPQRGFTPAVQWSNPALNIATVIRHQLGSDTKATVVDLTGDGVPDRLVVDSGGFWKFWRGKPWTEASTGLGFAGTPATAETWGWNCNPDGSGCSSIPDPSAAIHKGGESGLERWLEATLVDMDGDGLPDRVLSTDSGDWSFLKNVGTGFASAVPWPGPADQTPACPHRHQINSSTLTSLQSPNTAYGRSQLVDVNGDGLPDHVAGCSGVNQKVDVSINTGSATTGFAPPTPWSGEFIIGSQLLEGIYQASSSPGLPGLSEPFRSKYPAFADLNGDGLPDRVLVSLTCPVWFGLGTGWQYTGGQGVQAQEQIACNVTSPVTWPEYQIVHPTDPIVRTFDTFLDLNGDGVIDKLGNTSITQAGTPGFWPVYFGKGDGAFLPFPVQWTAFSGFLDGSVRLEDYVGNVSEDVFDIDGDGLVDRIAYQVPDWNVWRHPGPPGLLKRATNELGGFTEIFYGPSTAFLDNAVSSQTHPELNVEANPAGGPLRTPVWVASRLEVHDGRGGSPQIQDRGYAEFRFDAERRRYLGARESESVDAAGAVTRSFYHQSKGLEGRPQLEERTDDSGNPYRSTIVTWSAVTPQNENGTPLPDSVFAAAIEKSVETYSPVDPQHSPQLRRVLRDFDPKFGHVINQVDLGGDGQTGGGDDFVIFKSYCPNTAYSSWLVDYPCLAFRSLGGQQAGIKLYSYDYQGRMTPPTQGLLTTRETERYLASVQSVYQQELWDYDAFGNPTLYVGPSDSWVATYEAGLATFVDSITNDLGQVSSFRTDVRFGELDRKVDPNGFLQCWGYDLFGRLASRSDNPSTIAPPISSACPVPLESFSFSNEGDPTQQHLSALQHAAEPDASVESRRYFDGIGRVYRSTTQATAQTDDSFVTAISWDDRGLVACRTLPVRQVPSLDVICESHTPRREFLYDLLSRRVETAFVTGSPSEPQSEQESTVGYSLESRPSPNDPTRQMELVVENHTVSGTPDLQRTLLLDAHGHSVFVSEGGEAETAFRRDGKGRVTLSDAPDVGADANLLAITYDSLGDRRRIVRPPSLADLSAGPTWEYEYDAFGHLTEVVPPRGSNFAVQYYYDELNRLTFEDVSPFTGPANLTDGDRRYNYDSTPFAIGRLTTSTSDVTKTFGYNLRGEIAQKDVQFQFIGASFTFAYEYDQLGRAVQVTYPDADVFRWQYEGSLLSRVFRPGPPEETLLDQIAFDENRRLAYLSYSSLDLNTTRTYDPQTQRLATIRTLKDSVPIQDLDYDVDIAGNVLSITDGLERLSETYTYDGVHRLQAATATGTVAFAYPPQAYAYDAPTGTGNLVEKDSNTLSYGELAAPPTAVTSVSQGGSSSVTYQYDDDGSAWVKDLSWTLVTLSRGPEGRLESVDPGTGLPTVYYYDEQNRRVAKFNTSNLRVRTYLDGFYEIHEDYSQSPPLRTHLKHLFAGGLRALSIQRDGQGTSADPGDPATETRLHYHPDHVGSNVLVTGSNGEVLQRTFFKPFGTVVWILDGSENLLFPGSWVTQHLFTDQELDPETNFYYYGARYYDPYVGRFLSVDPEVIGPQVGISFRRALSSPENLNTHAYAANRPTVLVDPTGAFNQSGPVFHDAGGAIGLSSADAYTLSPVDVLLFPIKNHPAFRMLKAIGLLVVLSQTIPDSDTIRSQIDIVFQESGEELIGDNPRDAGDRTNTDRPGGRQAAEKKFKELTKGQPTIKRPMPNGGERERAPDGTQIRRNPDGTTRIDLPGRGPHGLEVIHY